MANKKIDRDAFQSYAAKDDLAAFDAYVGRKKWKKAEITSGLMAMFMALPADEFRDAIVEFPIEIAKWIALQKGVLKEIQVLRARVQQPHAAPPVVRGEKGVGTK